MGQETMGKKDREQKKKKNQKEKAERKKEREANNSKGKGLDSMMAYIDENGNITDTPPDPSRKKEIELDQIQLGAAARLPEDPADLIRTGTVSFFNDAKGYGFITDSVTRQNIFVHANGLTEPIKDRDRVTFEIGSGPKGPVAQKVKKVK
ncbi:MAG: cold shock domain-containing protein [Flavipsychrobacter sp.]|nr:cold shock domain-containing protein [Flavipsychrobacter sp.]